MSVAFSTVPDIARFTLSRALPGRRPVPRVAASVTFRRKDSGDAEVCARHHRTSRCDRGSSARSCSWFECRGLHRQRWQCKEFFGPVPRTADVVGRDHNGAGAASPPVGAGHAADDALRTDGIEHDEIVGVGVSSTGIVISVPSEELLDSASTGAERALDSILLSRPELRSAGALRYQVDTLKVTPTATPSGSEAQLYAYGPNTGCSIAGSTYTDFLGVRFWFWLTAGHCSSFAPVKSSFDPGPYPWESGSATGASDSGLFAIGTGTAPAPRARVLNDSGTLKNIAAQSDRPQFDVPGTSYVCGVGRTTATGCGTLISIQVGPINGVYFLREAARSPACAGGDSGGAYFGRYLDGTVALMGIIHGTSTGRCWYSDLALALNDRTTTLYRF